MIKHSLSSRMVFAYCTECPVLLDQLSLFRTGEQVEEFEEMYKEALCWRCYEKKTQVMECNAPCKEH